MNNNEAVEILQNIDKVYRQFTEKEIEALEMAIKALEQEPILGKIRAEIEHIIDNTYDSTDYDKSLYNGAYKDGLYEALDIIDKYKAESEEEE